MPFLVLDGLTVHVTRDAITQEYEEHGIDEPRMFNGILRRTIRGRYRKWGGTTAHLLEADADALIAKLTSPNLPLELSGDLVGATSCAVFPKLISNNPVQTAQGFRRRVAFSFRETPQALPPDTSAPIYRFYRRGVGMWGDWDRTVPALLGDEVAAWDDQMNAEFFLKGGLDPNTLGYNSGLAPLRESTGVAFGDQGYLRFGDDGSGDGNIDLLDGTGTEVMIGIRLSDPAPSVASLAGLWNTRWGGAVSGNSPDGSATVFLPHPNGKIYEHFALTNTVDLDEPVIDLDQFICYNIVALDNGVDPREWTVRLNGTEQYTTTPAGGAISLTDSHFWHFGADLGVSRLNGWITEMVFNTGKFTDRQRASWKDYMTGVVDDPPLPI